MALRPYPTSLDPSIWTEVAAVIEGVKKPDAHSVHCLEDTAAFALGQFYPDNTTASLPSTSKAMTKAEAAAVCKKMATPGMTAHAAVGGASWQTWLQLILQILSGVVSNLPPTPVA
jgi:hypothetical protein